MDSSGMRSGFCFKLHSMQLGIEAVFVHEVIVIAALHNCSIFDDEDHIRPANGSEAVRHDDAGAAFHQAVQRIADEFFGD